MTPAIALLASKVVIRVVLVVVLVGFSAWALCIYRYWTPR
jgi:hypothetical protein